MPVIKRLVVIAAKMAGAMIAVWLMFTIALNIILLPYPHAAVEEKCVGRTIVELPKCLGEIDVSK